MLLDGYTCEQHKDEHWVGRVAATLFGIGLPLASPANKYLQSWYLLSESHELHTVKVVPIAVYAVLLFGVAIASFVITFNHERSSRWCLVTALGLPGLFLAFVSNLSL